MSFYRHIRPFIFTLNPETAHQLVIAALSQPFWKSIYTPPASLRTHVAGLDFSSPIGLAAGFDKNAQTLRAMEKTGFGFAEIGTVTPKPQAGNPKPRIFRLKREQAVINRLGFNNEGLEAVSSRLQARPAHLVVGGNIGKNKLSEDAIADYVTGLTSLYEKVDYITVNISSPNTPGLRELQHHQALQELAQAVHRARAALLDAGAVKKPIFVKIAPDLDEAQCEAIAELAVMQSLDGLIVSNTTLSRAGLETRPRANEAGGLSGKPLMMMSTQLLARMYQLTSGKLPLIGVGGVSSAEDAYQKIIHGASLVQLYTAIIYQGLDIVREISEGLAERLIGDNFKTVNDAVGAAL